MKKNTILKNLMFAIIALSLFITGCDVTNPADDILVVLDAEISEPIINSQPSLTASTEVIELLSDFTLGSGSGSVLGKVVGSGNNIMAETQNIELNLGTIAEAAATLAGFGANVVNNSGNIANMTFTISTTSGAGATLILDQTIADGATVSSLAINTTALFGFFSSHPGQTYKLTIEATGDPNLNLKFNYLRFILPAVKNITGELDISDEKYNLEKILVTDIGGSITNNGTGDATISLYLATSYLSETTAGLNSFKIAGHVIAAGETYNFSKSTLNYFDQVLYDEMATKLIRDKNKLYSLISMSSSSNLNLSIEEVTLEGEFEVSLDL
ncbi:MAG: hypothetical protein JEY94_12855 [Melioribacteraceae bacterium]|nr:hypothetical protein [Melioribacteraceae bacterium]